MSEADSDVRYPAEEIANSITHGIGAFASTIALLVYATFGMSMVTLYVSSTLYHALPRSRAKEVFLRLDHSAIYLLIAGTYTPFTLGVLKGVWGWILFSLEWGLATAGITIKSVFGAKWPKMSMAFYMIMGWLMVIAIWPLVNRMQTTGLALIFAGGMFYTIGTIFNGLKRLKFAHMIWHIFVIIGSVFFFVAIIGGFAEPAS
jgi:hemolysin III